MFPLPLLLLAPLGEMLSTKTVTLPRFVEALPGGGLVTSPVHAIAGNAEHAERAAFKGAVSVAISGAAMGSPTVGTVAGAMIEGLKK